MEKEKIELSIILELDTDMCGMSIKDKDGNKVNFEDLSRLGQIKVLNCFSQYYNSLVRFLKEK